MFLLFDLILTMGLSFAEMDLRNTAMFRWPEQNQVREVVFHPVSPLWSKARECRYHGVAVPFVRDWDEEEGNEVKTIRKAEPDKLAGYAFLFNKVVCPNEEPKFVFNVGTHFTAYGAGKPFFTNMPVIAAGLNPKIEMQPKWLPQVTKIIENAAATDPVAKAFLDFSEESRNNMDARLKKEAIVPQEAKAVTQDAPGN